MNLLNKAWMICLLQLRRLKKDYRTYLIILILLFLVQKEMEPIFSFVKQAQYPVSPWIYPYLMGNQIVRIALFSCMTLMFANAFEETAYQRYQYLYAGRKAFFFGKVLYLLILSAIIAVLMWVIELLPRMSQIALQKDWGKLLGLLEKNQYHVTGLAPGASSGLLSRYSPLEASGYTMFFIWMGSFFLGMLSFVANSRNRIVNGSVICSAFVVLDFSMAMIVFTKLQGTLLYISPLSWSNLDFLNHNGVVNGSYYPDLSYAFAMILILNALLVGGSYYLMQTSYRTGSKHQMMVLFR